MIARQTVEEFCDALAAKTPSPGGGATAAIVGAVGASQLLMVAEYSKIPLDARGALRAAIAALLQLADEDAEAYATYRNARDDPAARDGSVAHSAGRRSLRRSSTRAPSTSWQGKDAARRVERLSDEKSGGSRPTTGRVRRRCPIGRTGRCP